MLLKIEGADSGKIEGTDSRKRFKLRERFLPRNM